MNESVLDLIKVEKELKIKKLKRSIQGQTFFNNRAIALGDDAKNSKKLGVTPKEHELKTIYYDMLDKYYHNKSFKFYKTNEKSVAFWRRVSECCDAAGVAPIAYISAQFHWFDQVFKTTPSLPSLITENAINRALGFNNNRSITSTVKPHKSEEIEVIKQTDKTVRAIMKAQKMTKEEFYKQLVLTGQFPVSKAYLNVDPVYQKLIK